MKSSIRDIMLFTVIVALAVGWWRDRSKLAAENQELRQQKPWFGDVSIESIRITSQPSALAPPSNPPKD